MNKGIGFNRTLTLAWLDAAAAFCAETRDPMEMRERLEPIVGQHLQGKEARRKTIDLLLNIWLRTEGIAPDLHAEAVSYFQATPVIGDRLWLHYGLTLLYYPFFRACAVAIGQLSRYGQPITRSMVKEKLAAERGHLGSLDRSAERVMASLHNWGILVHTEQLHVYIPQRRAFSASTDDLEAWLLACALHAHPAEELPFDDLLHLPELFPFRFTLSVDALRQRPRFVVQRQGADWDMVRLAQNRMGRT
ncbi:MAG: hypothetical protein H5T63_02720 [Chloroflexi bacterium]|nr:hypothetical protein [Chloroflexota bacterium]